MTFFVTLIIFRYFKRVFYTVFCGAYHQQTTFSRHMKEHMDVPIDTSNMSEQELQFHYFKMHDADGNNKLDGCELVKSLIHWHGT